jgi:hypothetical protein
LSDGTAAAGLSTLLALVAAHLALGAAHFIRSRLILTWGAIIALELLRIAVASTLIAIPHLQIELRDVSASVALTHRCH